MELTNRAMIVSLNMKGFWSAVAEDERVTAEVAQAHNVTTKAGRYMKKILDPKEVPTLKELNGARAALYNLHRSMTLAWDDKGGRMLPADQYFDYMSKIGDAKQKVIDKYEAFLRELPTLQSKASVDPETSGLYRTEDWPDAAELRDKVTIRVKVAPLADSADFRVKLGADEEAKIKTQIEGDTWGRVAGGLAELVRGLKECVSDSKERFEGFALDDHGKTIKTFRDSAITNIRNMTTTARKLNVLGDPTLNGMLDEIEKSLCSRDPQALRDNFVERQKAISDAAGIVAKLANIESVLVATAEAA